MAIPGNFAAIYLARYNMANLPAQVGIDLQTTGVYAQMISGTWRCWDRWQ